MNTVYVWCDTASYSFKNYQEHLHSGKWAFQPVKKIEAI